MIRISITDQLPEVGQVVRCQVNFWRRGELHHTEIVEAKFQGMDALLDKSMLDIYACDTYDTYDIYDIVAWSVEPQSRDNQPEKVQS